MIITCHIDNISIGVLALGLLCMGVSVPSQVDAAKTKTQKIKLSQTKLTMTVGKTKTLKVKGTPAKLAKKVKWISSKTKVVKVSSKGKLTAKKTSTAPTSGSAISYPTWGLADAPTGVVTPGAIQYTSQYIPVNLRSGLSSYVPNACFKDYQTFYNFFYGAGRIVDIEKTSVTSLTKEKLSKYNEAFFKDKVLFYTDKVSNYGNDSYIITKVQKRKNPFYGLDCEMVMEKEPRIPGAAYTQSISASGCLVELNRSDLAGVCIIYTRIAD